MARHVTVRESLVGHHPGADAHARSVAGPQLNVQAIRQMDGFDEPGLDRLANLQARSAAKVERRGLEFGACHRLSQRSASSGAAGCMLMQSTGQGARHSSQPVQ
jgi:hypothetical protein